MLLKTFTRFLKQLQASLQRNRVSRGAAPRHLLNEFKRRERLISEAKRARQLSEEEEERVMQEASEALAWARTQLRRPRKEH